MSSNNVMSTVKRLMFAGTMLACGLLCVPFADAASPADAVPAVTVKYGDLDLSTTGGVQTLYRRIVAAAKRVCPSDTSRDLSRLAMVEACRADAITRAVHAVNNPQLAQVHEQSFHHG